MSVDFPKIVIAPDSFKGSLSAAEVAAAIASGLRTALPHLPSESILELPLADGGEGTLDTVLSVVKGDRHVGPVTSAAGYQRMAAMGYCYPVQEDPFVMLEAAQVVGITDTAAMATHVVNRSTRGLGEQIRQGLDRGIRKFYIGLGGSSTNDGGAGLLSALGIQFLDAMGQPMEPTPIGLLNLVTVNVEHLDPRVRETQFILLSDVKNPLCGKHGATYTFGPQKGLTDSALQDCIDRTLKRYAKLTTQAIVSIPDWPYSTQNLHRQKGAGAAGGLGFALQLLGAEYRSGAKEIAQLVRLPEALATATWLITGEGKSDRQTLSGKVPCRVARMAQKAKVENITLLSGMIEASDRKRLQKQLHTEDCFSLMPGANCIFLPEEAPPSLANCQIHACDWLIKAGECLGNRWLAQTRRISLESDPC
jgi:glycerate 2-kinase